MDAFQIIYPVGEPIQTEEYGLVEIIKYIKTKDEYEIIIKETGEILTTKDLTMKMLCSTK